MLDSSTGQWEVHKDVSPLDDSLPALFHCSAGTDRTGMVAALVPGIAGVAPEVIARE